MNFLAHAYLSFNATDILIGNMIGDFVKGKKKYDYPGDIPKGIALHRAIDSYTDSHTVTRAAKSYFRQPYGLYAGALVDIVFDHFLANDPGIFSREELASFAAGVYRNLDSYRGMLPDKFLRIRPYMQSQNWLYNYHSREAIFRSFAGLSSRAAYMPESGKACELFETHYHELEACYGGFFPELRAFAFTTLQELKMGPDGRKAED